MLTALREGSEGFMLAWKKISRAVNLNLIAVINQIDFSWPQRINLDVVVDCHWSMTPFVIILRIFRNIVESWLLDYSFFADIAPEIRASKVETSFGQSGSCKRKPFSSKTIWSRSTLPAHCLKSRLFWKTQYSVDSFSLIFPLFEDDSGKRKG